MYFARKLLTILLFGFLGTTCWNYYLNTNFSNIIQSCRNADNGTKSCYSILFPRSLVACVEECLLRPARCKAVLFRNRVKVCMLCEATVTGSESQEWSSSLLCEMRPEYAELIPSCNSTTCEEPWRQKCPSSRQSDCSYSECPIPPYIEWSTYVSQETNIGVGVQYVCIPGYRSIGTSSVITCQANGVWTTTDFECRYIAKPGEICDSSTECCDNTECVDHDDDSSTQNTCRCLTSYYQTNEQCLNPFRQWVFAVRNFSSEYQGDHGDYFANKLIGPADVYPTYGDLAGSWAPENGMTSFEYAEVEYAIPVYLHSVKVYETFLAGGVVQIKAESDEGTWHTLWSTLAPEKLEFARIFSPSITPTNYTTAAIRIEIDQTASGYFVEIDAIEIVGIRP